MSNYSDNSLKNSPATSLQEFGLFKKLPKKHSIFKASAVAQHPTHTGNRYGIVVPESTLNLAAANAQELTESAIKAAENANQKHAKIISDTSSLHFQRDILEELKRGPYVMGEPTAVLTFQAEEGINPTISSQNGKKVCFEEGFISADSLCATYVAGERKLDASIASTKVSGPVDARFTELVVNLPKAQAIESPAEAQAAREPEASTELPAKSRSFGHIS